MAFRARPHLPGEYYPALLSPPEDEGILPTTHSYFDPPVHGFVPGLNTIPLDFWSASSLAGFTEFTTEHVAVPSTPTLDDPNKPDPAPEHPFRPSSAKKPRARRKNDTNERQPRDSSKRKFSRDKRANVWIDGDREKPSSQGNDGNAYGGDTLVQREGNGNPERTHNKASLVASHKYRVQKKQASQRLQIDKRNSEQVNSNLTDCKADLTCEVYELRMQLLQHSHCNCTLIQRYIALEAEQFIESIEESQDSNGRDIAREPLAKHLVRWDGR